MTGTTPTESRSSILKERIIGFLSSDPILRGVLIIGSGTALSQILKVLFVPILTRIYPPAIYGTLAIFTSVLSILIVLSTLRYDTPVPLADTDEDAEYLMIISLLITGGVTIILLFVTIVYGEALSRSLNLEFLSPHFWLLGVYFLILSTFGIVTHWVLRERSYGKIARAGVSQSISGSVCKIILGLLGFGSFGLIFGEFVALVIGIGVLGGAIIPRLVSRARNLQIERIIHLVREYKRFPIYSVPSGLINELSLQAPTLLISTLFGFETVGYFSLSYSMLVMPISLISSSIAQVFFGESSELLRTKSQEILWLYRKTTRRLFMFGTPVICIAAIVFPIVFPL
ncbi:MAG TPA: oligosaccharide flippase family protein, partial [Methanoregulaceae archaeon]|nr:oligosaccharide flippase family protein [Methanoregulaceae archaeon]